MVTSRRLLALALVLVASLSFASPLEAHVAIRVLITFPRPGERVGAHTELRVFAQPFLGGVDTTTFTVDLDGRALDAAGRPSNSTPPIPIRVEETKRIPLHGLAKGDHTLTLSYRPDTDEPIQRESVTFVVEGGGTNRLLAGAAILGAALLILAGVRSFRAPRDRATPAEAVRPGG
ncbi:MAG: hypothetical protein ACRDGU_10410 [Actinomycetota bacterium]